MWPVRTPWRARTHYTCSRPKSSTSAIDCIEITFRLSKNSPRKLAEASESVIRSSSFDIRGPYRIVAILVSGRDLEFAVIVAMTVVRMVQVTVYQVIKVAAMGNRLMTAIRPVHVA